MVAQGTPHLGVVLEAGIQTGENYVFLFYLLIHPWARWLTFSTSISRMEFLDFSWEISMKFVP